MDIGPDECRAGWTQGWMNAGPDGHRARWTHLLECFLEVFVDDGIYDGVGYARRVTEPENEVHSKAGLDAADWTERSQ